MAIQLTTESHNLFMSFAKDADNWGGTPLVDITPAQKGNLTDLKSKGLLVTIKSDGNMFVDFTDEGKAYASENGVDLSWV